LSNRAGGLYSFIAGFADSSFFLLNLGLSSVAAFRSFMVTDPPLMIAPHSCP
jgi:hypothetical protein